MNNYAEILKKRENCGIRLNKYLADAGLCSRREADTYINDGRIKINGKTASMGQRVMPGDKVTADNKEVVPSTGELPYPPVGRQSPPLPGPDGKIRVYIAMNKPKGVVCTLNTDEKNSLPEFFPFPVRIFPIGRLDKQSTGLLLLTNDGDLVNRLLRVENHHEKEYVVSVDKPIDNDFLEKMSAGVPILDTVTLPCKIKQTGKNEFKIILTQGLNRQIRRMCEYLGYEVVSLNRIRISNISLGSMKSGDWRYLTHSELAQLEELLERKDVNGRA